MCHKVLQILCFHYFIILSKPVLPETVNHLESSNRTQVSELSSLKETLTALEDLTTAHRQMWEKQRAHEEQVRNKHKVEEDREAERSRALEAEQIVLRERSRQYARKFEMLTKRFAYNGDERISLGGSRAVTPDRDCSDIFLEGDETSGVKTVWPVWSENGKGFSVYCDMDTDGGGWTVIHRSTVDDLMSDYYNRSWNDYKNGFGDLESSFWLGNDRIYQLTRQRAYELRLDMEEDEEQTYSVYKRFFIEDESTKFKLHVSGYRPDGTGGNKLISYNGANFTTYDQKNLPRNLTLVTTRTYRNGYGQDIQEYPRPPRCAEKNACGWWFTTDCELDSSINPTRNMGKFEMKIRPRLYSQKLSDVKKPFL